MPLHIRPLVTDDRVVWGQMWRDYLSFYDTAIAPEIYETTFARLINPTNRVQNARVAELDGAAVDFSDLLFRTARLLKASAPARQRLAEEGRHRNPGAVIADGVAHTPLHTIRYRSTPKT